MAQKITNNSRESALLKAFRQMTSREQVKMLKTAMQILATPKPKPSQE